MCKPSIYAPRTKTIVRSALGSVVLFICVVCGQVTASGDTVTFTRDIRPILSNHCFKCHGPDDAAREADLRLDTFEGATSDHGNGRAVVPGDLQHSGMINRITAADPDLRMPPIDSGLELSEQQISVLKQWIKEGARYEQHWAFKALKSDFDEFPNDSGRNAIDVFIRRKLESAGLQFSEEANRHTLIRRIYLDLIGLPPSLEELDEFLNDTSPHAYEDLVDRVLSNPHFGEKWGRHWLDQARYADTNGYTVDTERSIWPYRDWVIHALNADLPFDEFTIRQLAGDMLEDPSQDELVATGFHRNTLVNQEGGTDREQFRNEAVVDRVNTTGAVWLGLTVGCAQCHTHKYDPLTHREYYQLFAFFNSGQDVNSVTPSISVATTEQQKTLAELDLKIKACTDALAAYDKRRQTSLPASERNSDKPVEWTIVEPSAIQSQSAAEFASLSDGSIVVSGRNADAEVYVVRFPSVTSRISAVRLETLTHPSLPRGGPGRAGNGNFVLNELEFRTGSDVAQWLHASADHSQKNYDVADAIDGDVTTGWAINVSSGNMNVNRTARFVCQPVPAASEATHEIVMTFDANPAGYNIGRFRIAVTDAPHSLLDLPDEQRSQLEAELKQAKGARAEFARKIPTTMVMGELPAPRENTILIRGDFLRKGDAVIPDTPAFLPPMLPSEGLRSRLDLARWLVSEENPLTPRVTVNRIWMRLFGQGLVETENDFGLQGTPPTHPELLDWLAARFMQNGWSVKKVIRLIVTSRTYRQSSLARRDVQQIDPLNKLLARQSRIRVDAEIVRDLALAASGLLDETIGGKSVYPPQPEGVYAFTQRNASWPTSTGSDRYRRGLYTFFMRSAPHPMLTTFDSPAFNTTCTRRTRSNTPLQSLTMSNDEAMFEMAQSLGRRLADEAGPSDEPGAVEAGIQTAFLLCFSRPATSDEVLRIAAYYAEQESGFRAALEDAKLVSGAKETDSTDVMAQAAWTMVARVLLNLDEFITRE